MTKPKDTPGWAEWLSNVKGSDEEMLAGFREWMRKDEAKRAEYTRAVMKGWLGDGGERAETIH